MNLKTLAGFLIAGMLAIVLWPNPALPFSGAPQEWKDGFHGPFFAVVTLLVYFLIPKGWETWRRILMAALIALGLSLSTEFLQPFFNRSFSHGDLLANTVGILVSASLIWIHRVRKSGLRVKIVHAIISVFALLAFFTPALLKYQATAWLAEQFPELSNFDDRRSEHFWVPQGNAHAARESGSLRISSRGGEFSGVNYFPGAQDWTSRSTLVLEFENPGPRIFLGIRIDDDGDCTSSGSRFSATLDLLPGESAHRISLEEVKNAPLGRELNLEAVTRIALYLSPEEPARVFFLKRAFLE